MGLRWCFSNSDELLTTKLHRRKSPVETPGAPRDTKESDILLSAPDIFLQSRIIDEGIAVLLAAIHGIVAVYLFLAYGVLLRPAQQHLDKP